MKCIIFSGIISLIFLLTGCMTEDMSDVLKRQQNHDQRITFLEEWVGEMNEEIKALQQIVNAMESSDFIKEIRETDTELTLLFGHAAPVTIRKGEQGESGAPGHDGSDGQPGTDGRPGTDGTNGTDAPRLAVKKENNRYYWTLTTPAGSQFLKDEQGNKIPVTGHKGETGEDARPGEDGKPGKTPELGISVAGNWTLDGWEIMVNGQPLPATGPEGHKGPDGSDGRDSDRTGSGSYFRTVDASSPGSVVFTLRDGTTFTLPKWQGLSFDLTAPSLIRLKRDESLTFSYTGQHINQLQITVPEGWSASADTLQKMITLTAPATGNLRAKAQGEFCVVVSNKTGAIRTESRGVKLWLPSYVVDASGCDFTESDVYLCYDGNNRLVAEICLEYIPGYTDLLKQRATVIYPRIPDEKRYGRGLVTNTGGSVLHDGTAYVVTTSLPASRLYVDTEGTIVAASAEAQPTTIKADRIEDADHHIYGIVKIGRQYWMKENLRTTKRWHENGTTMALEYPRAYDTFLPGKEISYGWLYDYSRVEQATTNTGYRLCPEKWHIPQSAEWTELTRFIPDSDALKAIHPDWKAPSVARPNDLSGFGALPGGYYEKNRPPTGPLDYYQSGYWWSGSEINGSKNVIICIGYDSKGYVRNSFDNYARLLSIRCIRDSEMSESVF